MADYNFLSAWKFDTAFKGVYNAIHNAYNYLLWWKVHSKVKTDSKKI
jgi:hypothetical protein